MSAPTTAQPDKGAGLGRDAIAVAVEKFADCGPGQWWFVHHPDGFLIECGSEHRARQIEDEVNAGRAALSKSRASGAEVEHG